MNKFENKTQAVKRHLEQKGSITSWEAIMQYRATRLSAIIFNLKERGMQISSEMKYKEDGTRFAIYRYSEKK